MADGWTTIIDVSEWTRLSEVDQHAKMLNTSREKAIENLVDKALSLPESGWTKMTSNLIISGTGRVGQSEMDYTARREGEEMVFVFTSPSQPAADISLVNEMSFTFRIPVKEFEGIMLLLKNGSM